MMSCSICLSLSDLLHLVGQSLVASSVVSGIISFLFMAESCSTVYMYHVFFIHSSVDGHFGCFLDLAIMNSAAVNTEVPVSL